MNQIILSRKAAKQFEMLPIHVARKLLKWSEQVSLFGITEIRKISGYHDEPLSGDRKGQRSVRLSRAYRAFYIERDDKITIEIIEVNKHEY